MASTGRVMVVVEDKERVIRKREMDDMICTWCASFVTASSVCGQFLGIATVFSRDCLFDWSLPSAAFI